MVRIGLMVALMMVPRLASATVAEVDTEKLLGWSEDGQTWAVLHSLQGGTQILIKRRGKIVFTVCNLQGEPSPTAGECKRSKRVAVVDVASKGKRDGLERINIETHKKLARFKLKRVSSKWRKDFKKAFKLGWGRSVKEDGRRCVKGWTLTRKSDKKRVKRVRIKKGCEKPLGGYMSTNGKYVLIKTESYKGPTEESGDTYEGTEYVWVKL